MEIKIDFLARNPITPGDYSIPIRATLPDGQTFESFATIKVYSPVSAELVPPAKEQSARLQIECAALIASGELRPVEWGE